MPIIEWEKKYNTGVQQIDLHHQYLFSLLNKTYDNFVYDGSIEGMSGIFDELIDYAIYHFFTEEQIMEKYHFPDLEAHKQLHEIFSNKIVDMQKDFTKGKRGMSLEMLSFLQEWLSNHILESDSEIGRFLASVKMSETDVRRENNKRTRIDIRG